MKDKRKEYCNYREFNSHSKEKVERAREIYDFKNISTSDGKVLFKDELGNVSLFKRGLSDQMTRLSLNALVIFSLKNQNTYSSLSIIFEQYANVILSRIFLKDGISIFLFKF